MSKEEAAAKAVADIRKEFKDNGAIMSLGERIVAEIPSVSTGIYTVDNHLIGTGGFPRGRITEVFGPESGGKTTLCLSAVASAQRSGGLAAFIDVEHALDKSWAERIAVDCNKLLVAQPDCGEDALAIAERLIVSEAFDIIVVDSVAALVPRAEINGDFGDSHMGLQARLMSQAMRKLTGAIARANTSVVFINQIRSNLGAYGSPDTTTGGRALKFYSSVRLDIRRLSAADKQIKKGTEVVGHTVKIKAVKNKVGIPYREAEVPFLYGVGFDRFASVVDAGLAAGIIEQKGSWFNYGIERMGQGAQAARDWVEATGLYDEIIGKVKAVKK